MIISSPWTNENPRLRALGVLLGLGLLVLLGALWHVQVLHGAHYDEREQEQSLRRIRIPSARGEIVDRQGVVLAENRPSYDVVIYLDQLRRRSKREDIVRLAAASLSTASRLLDLEVGLTEQQVRNHYARRRPLPLTVWRDVSAETVAAFAERAAHIPGLDLIVSPVRQYPFGSLAAHVLGFVGRPQQTPDEELEHFYYYEPDQAGKQGIELACDDSLRGAPGGRTIRVNPAGLTVDEIGYRPAQRGHRVVLTLDARCQQLIEAALSRAVLPAGRAGPLRGAAVLLDPRTGAVVAMASLPTFDPNIFTPGTPASLVHEVLTNAASPMLNRAVGARYAPGSTFKPMTLLAGLQQGRVNPRDTSACSGSIRIGNWPRPFACWNRHGHGRVNALDAMKQSCDVWFYEHGMATGVEAIARLATDFGLGRTTGIELAGEQAGLVPTPDWKRAQRGEGWWNGDTAQLAIGQSFLLVTPLQMAGLIAAIANGGVLYRPYLVAHHETADGEPEPPTAPAVTGTVRLSPHHLDTVRQSLWLAVNDPQGTGHRAAVRGLSVAGKTGTAEFETSQGRIKRAWFVGYAPYERPQFALAVVFEDADGGGHTAAPVAGQIFAGLFGKAAEAGDAGQEGWYGD